MFFSVSFNCSCYKLIHNHTLKQPPRKLFHRRVSKSLSAPTISNSFIAQKSRLLSTLIVVTSSEPRFANNISIDDPKSFSKTSSATLKLSDGSLLNQSIQRESSRSINRPWDLLNSGSEGLWSTQSRERALDCCVFIRVQHVPGAYIHRREVYLLSPKYNDDPQIVSEHLQDTRESMFRESTRRIFFFTLSERTLKTKSTPL